MNMLKRSLSNRHAQRGAAVPMVVIVIIILALIALGAWLLIVRPSRTASSNLVAQPPAAAASAAAAQTPPPANVASMSTGQLLDEARNAVRAQRWVAPAGNNAFEFYLKVLDKDPNNQVAQDALRESFTTGAKAAEQSINANDFDEAQREIDLLAKADAGNYTLTILRSKLDAQRKLSARAEEQQKQQDLLAEQHAAAQAAAAAAAAAAPPPPPAEATLAPPQAPTRVVTAKPPPPVVPKPAPPKPQGVTRDAQLLHSALAIPPRVAVRRHQSGWVDVQFTVTANGTVANAHVVDSRPGHIFDRAALDAVNKYTFKPAMRNGQPVTAVLKQRIQFTL